MPKTHTIAQGETLTRIARQHKYTSWKDLYHHPDNKAFREKRDNPDIIFPGDTITIPDPEPRAQTVKAGASYTFQLKAEKEMLRLNVGAGAEIPLEGKKATLEVGGQTLDTTITADGFIEIELPEEGATTGELALYLDDESSDPSHIFELDVGHLDPIEELSGVQARCNALGFDCGVVDGVMGSKTRYGVQSFQEMHELEVDGEPGPITQAKLKDVYGC